MPTYYEWDPRKATANLAKHGIAFEDAVEVFDDPSALSIQDRIEAHELRWRVTGLTEHWVLLVVAYANWDEEHDVEIIRIISARRAKRRERRLYEAGRAGDGSV